MTTAAVTLALIAAALEIWGIWRTIKDICTARQRLASYLDFPRTVYGSAHGLFGGLRMTATGTVHGQTLEQRIQALEAAQRGLRDELDRREERARERLRNEFQGALKASEKTIDDQVTKLRGYVVGDGQTSRTRAYRGPIVLGIGIVVGLVGNIFSSL
ncbi:hypothetical protein [Streptomyces sp. GESEQ-35]|uniref:hypothetical protein n=1 Tax=Streptomyces sp. GESEQ-35 TaxID=2812657 RepID=UPI001B31D933|nr:hypothetical protein [Streptomyces sp. GESEQ-35]